MSEVSSLQQVVTNGSSSTAAATLESTTTTTATTTTTTTSPGEPDAALSTNENSESSWNGSSSNSAVRRAAEQKLSVVIPANQKSLLTPTIITSEPGAGPSPTHLFSSLIQLNSHEVGLFTGLPSCTPTSADSLAKSNLAGINPFFWGVSNFSGTTATADADQKNQVKRSTQQPQENTLTISGKASPIKQKAVSNRDQSVVYDDNAANNATLEKQQQQLNKLSIDQLQAANAILSPLSLFLSPDGIRFGLPSQHPLAGRTGACDLAAKSNLDSNFLQVGNATTDHHLSSEQLRLSAAQDLTSQLSTNQPQNSTHQQLTQSHFSHQHHHHHQQHHHQNQHHQPQHYQLPNSQLHNQHLSEIPTNQNHNVTNTQLLNPTFETYLQQQTAAPNQQQINMAIQTDSASNVNCSTTENHLSAINTSQQVLKKGLEYASTTAAGRAQIVYQTTPNGQSSYIQGQLVPALLQQTQLKQSNLNGTSGTDNPVLVRNQPDTCIVPPIAHHQQQATLMVLGKDQMSNHVIRNSRELHPEQSMNIYEPRFRHFYLAQHHHHQQQQQQQQNSFNVQQQQQNYQELSIRPYNPHQYDLNSANSSYATTRPQIQLNSYVPTGSSEALVSSNQNSTTSSSNASPDQHTHSEGLSPAGSNTSLDTSKVDDASLSALSSTPKHISHIRQTGSQVNSKMQPVVTAATPVVAMNKKVTKKTATLLNKEPDSSNGEVVKKKSKGGRKKKQVTHDELIARKNRSKERNRVAAKRCRQKRKQFLDELCGRIDDLNDINKKLLRENSMLKKELEAIKHRLTSEKNDSIQVDSADHFLQTSR